MLGPDYIFFLPSFKERKKVWANFHNFFLPSADHQFASHVVPEGPHFGEITGKWGGRNILFQWEKCLVWPVNFVWIQTIVCSVLELVCVAFSFTKHMNSPCRLSIHSILCKQNYSGNFWMLNFIVYGPCVYGLNLVIVSGHSGCLK